MGLGPHPSPGKKSTPASAGPTAPASLAPQPQRVTPFLRSPHCSGAAARMGLSGAGRRLPHTWQETLPTPFSARTLFAPRSRGLGEHGSSSLPWPPSQLRIAGPRNEVGTPAYSPVAPPHRGPWTIQTRHSDRGGTGGRRRRQTERTGATRTCTENRATWGAQGRVCPQSTPKDQLTHTLTPPWSKAGVAPSSASTGDSCLNSHWGLSAGTTAQGSPTPDKKLTQPAWGKLESQKGEG